MPVCPECHQPIRNAARLERHRARVHGVGIAKAPTPNPSPARRVARVIWAPIYSAGEFLLGVGGCVGTLLFVPVALIVFWVAVSYVVMVVAWAFGLGDLHAFPEVLLIPDNDCGPGGCPPAAPGYER
jgi:hypothetical protein